MSAAGNNAILNKLLHNLVEVPHLEQAYNLTTYVNYILCNYYL